MKRKLVKQGAATLMISLPSKWLKEHNLDKGSEINLEQSDNTLIISTDETKSKNQVEIKLQDLSESSIRTLITNTYRKGYNQIIIEFENQTQLKILEDTIKTKLIGFDIIRKEKNKCIVENITEPSENQFDNILEKMFQNISELINITEKRFEGKKPEESFEDVEQRIMQYDNFCRRVISKRILIKSRKEFFWTFLHLIDHGQRELYHLNKTIGSLKISKPLLDILASCKKMFELAKKAYFEKEVKFLSEMHTLDKNAFYKKGYSTLEKLKGKEVIIGYHLMACLRKFFQTNSPLTGLLL